MLTTLLLLSISRTSIIQTVIEKHYLNPVLTEIQALSFPQGRHNWIPLEAAAAAKCRARRVLLLSVFPFLPFSISVSLIWPESPSQPIYPGEINPLREYVRVGKKVYECPNFTEDILKGITEWMAAVSLSLTSEYDNKSHANLSPM